MSNLNGTENSTSEDFALSAAHKVIFLGVWQVAFALNLLTCIFMGRIAHKKKSWPNILVFVLSLADLWILVAGLLPAVVAMFVNNLLSRYPQLCSYQAIVLNSWYLFSFAVVVFIGLDQYLAICHPFYYSHKISRSESTRGIGIALATIGLVTIFVSCLPVMLGERFMVIPPGLYCFFDSESDDVQNIAISVINALFVLAVISMLGYFVAGICIGIYKMVQSARQRVSGLPNTGGQSSSSREMNFAKLAVIMIAVFAACSLPRTVTLILHLTTGYRDPHADYIALSVLLLNSVLNPIMHALVRKPVRAAYKHIGKWTVYFCCCCQEMRKPVKEFDDVLGLSRKPTFRLQPTCIYNRNIFAKSLTSDQSKPDVAEDTPKHHSSEEAGATIASSPLKITDMATGITEGHSVIASECVQAAAILNISQKTLSDIEYRLSENGREQRQHETVEPSCFHETANSTFSYYNASSFNKEQ